MDGATLMAIYHVKGPDGIEHELEGPEGATDEQVIAKAREAFGHQQPEAPMPAAIEADKGGLQDVSIADTVAAPFMAADAAGEGAAEGLGKAGHPVAGAVVGTALQMAPYAPAAISGIKAAGPIGETITNGVKNYLSKNAGKFARKTAIEAIEPTTTNIDQLKDKLGGRQGVEDAGQYLLDQKVVTPGASADDMTARLGGLADRAGRHIGEWRDKADLRSIAQGAERPSSLDIEKAIREKLAAKYGPGAEAGQGSELQNAIDEVRKMAPVEESSTGAEMAQTVENGMPQEPTPGNKFWRDYYGVAPDEVDAYEAARAADDAGSLARGTRTYRPGQQTGPQSFEPGSPNPIQTGGPAPVESFPYLNDQPTFTDLSDTATRLNDVARNARQINQPSGAMTDAANVLSQKSTEGLENFLQPTEQGAFAADKAEFGLTKGLEQITDRTASRDMAGSIGSTPVSRYAWYSQVFHKVMPLSRQASYADKISKAMKLNPQAFGRNAQVLQRAMQAGKASLNSTIYMLQQQDPDFKEEFEEMNKQ
jgi:hypothetical protein